MLLSVAYLWLLGSSTLNSLTEFVKPCLVDDVWLTLEAGGFKTVVSEVPVHFFHRCSALLVMLH